MIISGRDIEFAKDHPGRAAKCDNSGDSSSFFPIALDGNHRAKGRLRNGVVVIAGILHNDDDGGVGRRHA